MAEYKVQAPDGSVMRIQGPENATDREIVQVAAQEFGKRQAAERALYDPTKGMSGAEKFLAGAGKAFTDIGRGVGQLVGALSNDDVKESRRLDAPLMKTGAGVAGNIVGNLVAAAPAVLIPGANTVVGAGAIGAGFGAVQPAESAAERASNTLLSGVLSSGVTAGVRALPALKQAVIDPFTTSGRERIAGDVLRRSVGSNLAPEASAVPGVQRTLAEATGDVGAAQLERSLKAASPDAGRLLAERQIANNEAMIGAVGKIAGTPQEKAMNEAMRGYMATRYSDAMAKGIDPKAAADPIVRAQMTDLMKRPSIQAAMGEARKLAAEDGIQMTKAGSLEGLHYVKLALDDAISRASNPTTALGKNELSKLVQAKSDLMKTLESLSPTYKQAAEEFALFSRPINQNQVGEELLRRMQNGTATAVRDLGVDLPSTVASNNLTSATFGRALADTDALVSKATGMGLPIEKLLSDSQMQTVKGVLADLSRRQFAENAGRVPGSPTAQYMAGSNMLRSIMGPLGLPQGWADTVLGQTLGGRGLSALARPAETKLQETLAQALMDPAMAAALLSRQPGATARTLSDLSRYALPPAAIGSGNSAKQ